MRQHVVVIGAGFAGLSAARRLGRQGRGRVQVTVVDSRNHHTFQPLLYQVATSALQPQDIAHSARGALRGLPNVGFRLGEVTGVDWATRRLAFADGGDLAFDRLVVAAGAVTAHYGVPGVAEHAFGLKSISESVALRDHVISQFERVSRNPSSIEDGALTFVVAGGGPTGVEVAGALAELVDRALRRDFPEVPVDRTRIFLVERDSALLAGFVPRSRDYAVRALGDRGVNVVLDSGIEEVGPGWVRLAEDRVVACQTVVWAAGVRAHPLAGALGLEQAASGRIATGEDLRVPDRPEVFAIGDIAAIPDGDGGLVPQLAPAAMQQGRHVADELLREARQEPPQVFRYKDKGIMATIGRNNAVAQLPYRLAFRGRPAWLAWLLLHLVFLMGFRNRASVMLHWAWSYCTQDRGARAVLSDPPATSRSVPALPSGSSDRRGGSSAPDRADSSDAHAPLPWS